MINKIQRKIDECTDHIELMKLQEELIKEYIIVEINKNMRKLSRSQLEKVYKNSCNL